MDYRQDKNGNKLSMLGLGCMRFGRDKAETERLILTAIDSGINYFDTAYIYPGSETALGEILAKNNRRKDINIATKLPLNMCKSYEDFDKFFNIQLKRLQTDYIDYYFMHSIISLAQWQTMVDLGIEKWLAEKTAAGKIRQVGFSYHGTQGDFIALLDAYDWQFCMIQYNYYDENYQAGRIGLNAAAAKGLAVIVMEPLLGGRLATGLPKAAADIFRKADPARSPADWALRWLWSHPEITLVLSGMPNTQILGYNLKSAANFTPLDPADANIYNEVINIFKKSYKFPCTACNYCLPCPVGINIPACLSAYNTSFAQNWFTGITMYMTGIGALSKTPTGARACIHCGKCEKSCPQNIPITHALKKTAARLEPPPIRAALAAARVFLR